MAECFSCMSPRLGKEDMKQPVFFDDNEVEDHRDEGEQETTQDEFRDEPSPSNDTRDFEFRETPLEQTESKTISKQEEILRKLGILYLDDKVTRARIHETETDEVILREAGVSLVDTPEYKQEEEKKTMIDKKEEFIKKISNKTINEREAKILKESGVLSLSGFSITKDENPTTDDTHLETIENKPLSVTTTSDSTTLASGSINSSYADRKLRRRLRKGWTTTGRECMCGMPVIFLKGTYECVICGVVEEETYCDEVEHIQQVESHMVGGSPGVFLLSSDDTTLPSVDHTDQAEEALRAELGHRLFSGWVLVGTRCPACSLPLIGNNSDTPAACVRCG
mmetsp:Transcript_21989/g.33586  ORF Transcript_21989/g.33586 Transcript_21989/m.33586 type:complete len:338 (-) Transcript_21989:15-1028(-)